MNIKRFKNPFTLDLLCDSINRFQHESLVSEALERQNPMLVDIKHKRGEKSALITCPVCNHRTIINYKLYKNAYEEWYCKQCGQRLVLERP